jgi:sugar O-acyltransferase (sialic acid O-acetyltransferase NeuD family)
MKIAIVGSGDLARQITHYSETDLKYKVVGFFDDFLEMGSLINGKVILGDIDAVIENYKQNVFDRLVVGIGYKHLDVRARVFDRFKASIPFENIIHPTCNIDNSATIGTGTVLFPGSIIDMNVSIGDNVLLNIDCSIAHDTSIGNHTFLSPSVKIAGFCSIGNKCNLGINTTIIDNIDIVDKVQTGGGTVIIKNITKEGLYVGNPQRYIK